MPATKRALFLCFVSRLALCSLALVTSALGAEKLTAPQLIELAKSNSPSLRDAITATFEPKDRKEGTAWAGRGPDFFFAPEAPSQPSLFLHPPPVPHFHHLPPSP